MSGYFFDLIEEPFDEASVVGSNDSVDISLFDVEGK